MCSQRGQQIDTDTEGAVLDPRFISYNRELQ